jgi:hypothetical protein
MGLLLAECSGLKAGDADSSLVTIRCFGHWDVSLWLADWNRQGKHNASAREDDHEGEEHQRRPLTKKG